MVDEPERRSCITVLNLGLRGRSRASKVQSPDRTQHEGDRRPREAGEVSLLEWLTNAARAAVAEE